MGFPGVWAIVADGRTCPFCLAMRGQFLWSDSWAAPPAHHGCRCVLLRLPIDVETLTPAQHIELGAALRAGEKMARRLGRLGPAGAGGNLAARSRRARGRVAAWAPGAALPIAGRLGLPDFPTARLPDSLQAASDAAGRGLQRASVDAGSWLQRLSDAAFAEFNRAAGAGDERPRQGGGRSGFE